MEIPVTIEGGGLILVEGKDDENILQLLLSSLGVVPPQIVSMGGKDDWVRKVSAISKTRGFGKVRFLLLVRDADADAAVALASIQGCLRHAKLPVAAGPGVWERTSRIACAYYILSGPDTTGELEDLCLEAVSRPELLECAKETAHCLSARGLMPTKRAKFLVQVYLASLPAVVDTLALGAKSKAFDAGHTAFTPLRGLLQDMASSAAS